METITLVAPDIHCGHCVGTIEGALGKLEGVRRVQGDIESKQVKVVYDAAKIDVEAIRRSMAEVGYPPAR